LLVWHHYLYRIVASDLTYSANFDRPLKAAIHDRVRFVVKKDRLIVLDQDGKQRAGDILSRERAPH
jgi:hypothetical protein